MTMRALRLLFLALMAIILAVPLTVAAAKPRRVEATVVYQVPETQSLFDARAEAVRRARHKALEDAFGTLVAVTTATEIADGRSSVRAHGLSELRGEWLSDIGEPRQNVWWDAERQALVIETTVSGKAREITSPDFDVSATLVRHPSDSGETLVYNDGDNVYLRLRSSRDGFLAAFLIDDAGSVSTLLPYASDSRSASVPISRGTEYTFFDPSSAPAGLQGATTRIRLRAPRRDEHNRICIVFSPNEFTRSAAETSAGSNRVAVTPFADFDKWLFRARTADPSLTAIFKDITIKKNTL